MPIQTKAQLAAFLTSNINNSSCYLNYLDLADQLSQQSSFTYNLAAKQNYAWLVAAAMIEAPSGTTFATVGNTNFSYLNGEQTPFKTLMYDFDLNYASSFNISLSWNQLQNQSINLCSQISQYVEQQSYASGFNGIPSKEISLLDVSGTPKALGLPPAAFAGGPIGAIFGLNTNTWDWPPNLMTWSGIWAKTVSQNPNLLGQLSAGVGDNVIDSAVNGVVNIIQTSAGFYSWVKGSNYPSIYQPSDNSNADQVLADWLGPSIQAEIQPALLQIQQALAASGANGGTPTLAGGPAKLPSDPLSGLGEALKKRGTRTNLHDT